MGPALAFQVRSEKSRFDALEIPNRSASSGVTGAPLRSFGTTDPAVAAWTAWRAARGGSWDITIDRRSGAPLLVQGSGVAWYAEGSALPATATTGSRATGGPAGTDPALPVAVAPTVAALERSLRDFMKQHVALLLARDEELVLDPASSGPMGDAGAWQVVFSRAVDGIPVDGDRYLFHFGHGRLIAFGATRWIPIAVSTVPRISREEALLALRRYMALTPRDVVTPVASGALVLLPRPADGTDAAPYEGSVGAGYDAALVWRFALRVAGEPGTWEGSVDAHTGAVVSFENTDRYAQVKGAVYPLSNDQFCPSGCEQPSYPMPYAALTVGDHPQTANGSGLYECAPGEVAATSLAGANVHVNDTCGPIEASALCGADLDLGGGAGTDCDVPSGWSPGDTHAARTGFYHLNRIIEKARVYLPAVGWLTRPLVDNVNINDTCNAFWNGVSVNFYKSGNGCRNTGEIAGIFLHEWGHGLDQNDGGGFDNPPEAYADIASFLQTHSSCIGRGFLQEGTCYGYGNVCLTCTGVRDVDWEQRAHGKPSTPPIFVAHNCPLGTGPCGGEIHCEAYVSDEAMWDFAARDLPASGVDPATAWEVVERLWYLSRPGSGGPAYNCSIPLSDGCSASSWFTKMRAIDDDDGDLANGTPHAAALFAAFARHGIACGEAEDPANQDHTVCPALAAPVVTAQAAAQAALVSWPAVAGAASYRVLRGDGPCATTYTPVATIAASADGADAAFTDAGLADGFLVHYAVQAVGSNGACLSPLSGCTEVVPQPFAGIVTLDRGIYVCADMARMRVRDANAGGGGSAVTVHVTSTAEPAGETITLLPEPPGSPVYAGALPLTADPASPSDGRLTVADGEAITVTYLDADDGAGGHGLARTATASIDCVAPAITDVRATDVTGQSATIRWMTSEPADSSVHYGFSSPPGTKVATEARVLDHAVTLDGLAECRFYRFLVESTDLAGNLASDAGPAGGVGYTFTTSKNTHPSYPSGDIPVPIPDDDIAGAASTIVVSDDHVIRGITVRIAIEHAFDSDLIVSLISPNGTTIRLVERRGGGAHNFQDTVFDDAAATPIASGQAPFIGSYRPEEALSVFLNKRSAGAWTLKVQDVEAQDVGQITSWSLNLVFPDAVCGAHAAYAGDAIVEDLCASGGPGAGNGAWDSGERTRLSVSIENDGSVPLTNVRATVTPLTAGVDMVSNNVDYEDVPANATASPRDAQVVADLAPGFPCGSEAEFRLDITSDQGSWSSIFSRIIGRPFLTTTAAIDATFSGGIPAGWMIVNGGTGPGPASTWTTTNPGGRSFLPPLSLPVAMVDSDRAGVDAEQDEQLITPPRDLRTAILATLEWDQEFVWYPGRGDEKGDVDVRSSATGGAWVNVRRNQGSTTLEPDHRKIDITTLAAGAQNVQIRFHYYDASFEWWWAIDNVRLLATGQGGCAQSACALSLIPPPVPDGIFGTPMTARRMDASGGGAETIRLQWDVDSCPAAGNHLLYGDLAAVAAHQPLGAVCALDPGGVADWAGVPSGNLWFLIVGDNGSSLEGMWGTDSSGAPIGGSASSNQCGMTLRTNSAVCAGDVN